MALDLGNKNLVFRILPFLIQKILTETQIIICSNEILCSDPDPEYYCFGFLLLVLNLFNLSFIYPHFP